jgi:predicted HTH domain antitoxin
MSGLNTDIETIAALGGYENEDAVITDAVRELLRQRPELRLSVAVEQYRSEEVSLNRAAELAGVSTERFKDELAERGIGRDSGFLDREERERLLEEN